MTTTTIDNSFTTLRFEGAAKNSTPTTKLAARPLHDALVDIVVPVYNEAHGLAASVAKLHDFLAASFPYRFRITIADNGSVDNTWQIAQDLARQYSNVTAVHLDAKGRGRALKYVWNRSDADILAYMDVDLSTGLEALEPLVTPLIYGNAVLATGSRLQKQSQVVRSFKREVISRTYNYILRASLRLRTSDAQCGFKAIRADAASKLLPQIADDAWFFDTELLVKAERQGLHVSEVPVSWQEDADSRVRVIKTSVDDLRGIKRLRSELNARPRWEKLALAAVLIVTAILYNIGMTKNGYGNSFYAAAVQAGTHSWKAMFFGSIDASNFITVDKPPFALWLMEISTRIFGFHPWSMLLPNVLAGITTVYLVYAIVRRWFGAQSALIAGIVMALSPVAVMMFGFNNPDAALTLLLTGSMYAFVRAIENQRPLFWLAIAGILTGCAFNTKMLQGLIVLPVFALVYLVTAPPKFVIRLKNLLITIIPTALAVLWWPVIVWLAPAASRPYIGSSTDNNIWNLIFGYNGFGRLLGKSSGMGGMGGGIGRSARAMFDGIAPTGIGQIPAGLARGAANAMPGAMAGGGRGPGGAGFGGSTGIFRIFNTDFGPNIAWFITAALLGAVLVLWITRRAPRTDRRRIAILAWGGWLVAHMIVFSMVSGVIHPYYPVVMAPAIAALIGITVPIMITEYRRQRASAFILPLAIVATGITACILLGYQPTWLPWLRWAVLGLSLVSSAGLLLQLIAPAKKLVTPLLIIGAVAVSASPVAYSLATASVAHTGSVPSAGPEATGLRGSNNETASAEAVFVKYLLAHEGSAKWLVAVASANESAAIQISSGQPVMAVGGFNGSDDALSVAQLQKLVSSGQLRYYAVASSGGMGGFGGGRGGNSAVLAWVKAHATVVKYGGSKYTLYDLQ